MDWLRFPLVKRGKKKTRKAPAPSRLRLAFEVLERRICPSVFYDFNVIAKAGDQTLSGDNIDSFESEVSINDSGKVAFIGNLSGANGTGTAVLAGDGTGAGPQKISFSTQSTARNFSFPQIANDNLVVASESISSFFLIRTWDASKQGVFHIITESGNSPPEVEFDGVTLPSRANDGGVAFLGIPPGNVPAGLYFNNGPVASGPNDVLLSTVNGGGFRPLAGDGGRAVIRAGGTATDPIMLYQLGAAPVTIASTAMGFTSLGASPGISDSGSAVTFYGDLSAAGATALNTAQPQLPALMAGPGIFASLPAPGGAGPRVIVRIAGTSGELGFDASGNPIGFSSFDVNSRVAVIDQQLNGLAGASAAGDSLVISFGGTPSTASRPNPKTGAPLLFSANDALWTVRLDTDADLTTPAQLDYHATSPIPVVQVGDTINGAVVNGIFTHDPLSNARADWVNGMGAVRTPMKGDHMVAFEVSTAAGNMVVRGSHLDTDQDGLLDHWETKGIDIDQDGVIDLNLKAMGADPTKRDIFLEADWTAPRNGPDAADRWSNAPNAGVFQSLVNMFAAAPALPNGVPAGVTVHIDGGPGSDEAGNPYSMNMGTGSLQGGDLIHPTGAPNTHIDVVYFGQNLPNANIPNGVQAQSFDDVKKNFFGTTDKDSRELAFHYVVFSDFVDFIYSAANVPVAGTVSAATAGSLTANGTPFAAASLLYRDGSAFGGLRGHFVKITGGTGAGQIRGITNNTPSQLTLASNWATIPDNTSTFTLFQGNSGWSEVHFRPDNSSIPGNDEIISLGGWGVNASGRLATPYIQWRTLAHELGHTLGLRHGGTDHNSMKGNNYLSLMSYSWQIKLPPVPPAVGLIVNSYSGAGDPTFNDWANLQLDFQNALGHIGNSFNLGDTTVLTTDPDKQEQTVLDYETLNNAPLDLVAPTVSIDSPAANAVIPLSGNLTVNLTATDNVAVDHVTVSFDINGDGNTTDPGETVVATQSGPTSYTATFTNVAGPVGSRVISATAFDTSMFSAAASLTVNLSSVSQLAISNLSPTSVTAGGTVTFMVTAQDSSSQPVPSYTGTVLITSTDSNAMFNGSPLPGSYTFLAGDNGAHTFTITLVTAGSQTITVTDQASSTLFATTGPVIVAAGPFSKFLVSTLGGSTIAAGNSFLFTVQAADQFGNSVTSYSGPGVVTTTISPADPQSNFPITGTLNSSGFGFFLGNLKTAGSYTLTATAGTFTGASGSLTVTPASASYFTVAAPATATTGTPFNIAVKAFDFFGNVASAYTGHVHFTSSDGSATLPIDSTLTSGMGTFNVTLNSAGSQTIKATDTLSTNPIITGTSAAITTRGLVVNAFTPTSDGFKVAFSKPFIPGAIALYGSSLTTPQDVTLVGASIGSVVGTLIFDPDNKGFTFKASSAPLLAFHSTAVLPDDTYTVTIDSGTATNGFLDALGANLDGANNGSHANYITTFTVANGSKPVLTIFDFARGPDETHAIKVPNDTGHGIPITFYNALGVTDVTFTLSYNPSLLTMAGGLGGPQSDATDTGSSFTMLLTPGVFGQATFQFHDAAAQSGTVVLGDIVAMVPNSAASNYKAKELLQFISVSVNGSDFSGVWADGVHVNAYLGDVTGNGTIDGLDVATANTVARGTATGFNAFSLLDPAIVGDPASDISVDAGDVSDLAAFTVHLPLPAIPAIPTGLTITPVGADPTLSLGGGLQAISGLVSVPVLLDHPHPIGSTGMTEAILALTYNPSVLSVSDITLGSIPSAGEGWQLASVVDAATGQIGIEMFSMTPITAAQAGSLVTIAFHVLPAASLSATTVQLVNSVMPSGQQFMTQVDDAQGQFVLSPGLGRVVVQTSGVSVTTVPPAGQMLQIGSLPILNALLYQNSPGQLAADRLFLALGRKTAVADLDRLIGAWPQGSEQDDFPNDQQVADQPPASARGVEAQMPNK